MSNHLEAVRPGALTTVQDLGRHGYAHLAVPRSGALDVPAMTLANRLVGNPAGAAVLETTLDGAAFRAAETCRVAVTGADSRVRIGSREGTQGVPLTVEAGEIVDIGRARQGVRAYLAVAGGIAVPPVLGSRATDLLSGLGPDIVRRGSILPVGDVQRDHHDHHAGDLPPPTPPADGLDLAFHFGPRDDRLTPASISGLTTAAWTVTPRSNRIALRLAGPPLAWRTRDELSSEGVVLGSIQVPPDGQPVLFLADHPATGGYPVVAVVPAPDIWLCAQARPGSVIRLHASR